MALLNAEQPNSSKRMVLFLSENRGISKVLFILTTMSIQVSPFLFHIRPTRTRTVAVYRNELEGYLTMFLGLIEAVKNLIPSDFEFADRSYDAGQYQYLIDGNFEPKQIPGVHLGSFTKMSNYENNWAVFFESKSQGSLISQLIIFLDGDSYLCPKSRSTVMFFQCGPKNKLKYVQELQPCTYKFSVDVKC